MVFKQWKLIYMAVFVKILIAAWNTLDSYEENNLEMDDDKHHSQYNTVVPECEKLELPGNEILGRGVSHDSSIIWEFYNTKVPTGNEPKERIGLGVVETPAINQMIVASEQAGVNVSFVMKPSEEEYTRRIEEIIREQEADELSVAVKQLVTASRQAEENVNSVMKPSEEEYTRRIEEIIREQEAAESSVAVKQLVTAPKHTEQDLRMKLSEDEYNRRIEDLTNMQETVEMDTLVNSSGEMPIQNPIEEHRPYGMSERTSSSAIFQLPENSPYAYFNSAFLYIFLRTPSPFITAESIRIRFGGQFLSFLSSEQIVRALIVLLDNKLELPKEDQKEFIETIFGHIDYSLELVITKAQVVMLVDAMMRSNVPDYFEQVFLTWKMWYNFTVNEQEVMLKKAKMKYKREVLVMLYLFVMNRDGTNSQRCEIFKNNIKNQYKETGIFKYGYSLENLVRKGNEWMIGVFSIILDTFDTCLLDLPEVFKGLENNAISTFWNFFRNYFYTRDQKDVLHVLKYKSHVCYALTKFTPEFEQINNSGEINGIKRNSRLYFDPANVKLEFANWIRILKNNNRFGGTISTYGLEREFVNAFAMLRQISQCDEYNCNTLLTIFNNVNFTEHFDEPYFILLLSLTNENIFSDLIETQEWSEYVKARSKLTTEYRFIEEIFMNNACFDPSLHLKHHTKPCVIKIHEILFKLNMKGGIRMHREHYFYQRLLFHLRLDIFNGADLLGYIQGLDTIGCLSTKEQSVQIARDLVFSEYYCEAAMELKDKITMFKWWTKLGDGIRWIGKEWELYKNKEDIKRERGVFRRC